MSSALSLIIIKQAFSQTRLKSRPQPSHGTRNHLESIDFWYWCRGISSERPLSVLSWKSCIKVININPMQILKQNTVVKKANEWLQLLRTMGTEEPTVCVSWTKTIEARWVLVESRINRSGFFKSTGQELILGL